MAEVRLVDFLDETELPNGLSETDGLDLILDTFKKHGPFRVSTKLKIFYLLCFVPRVNASSA